MTKPAVAIRPERTLWLISTLHAVNHAQGVLLPLIYLRIIAEYGVGVETIAFLSAFGALLTGGVQLSYAWLARVVSRVSLLGWGGILLGAGFAAQALATGFGTFAAANVAGRLGAWPQHPAGNALLAEQFPPRRRGFAISAHIAGGNVGTVVIALAGAWLVAGLGWRWTVVLFGVPAIVIALGILAFVREAGTDRAEAVAHGSLRDGFATILRDRDHRWIFLASVLGGGGRGLGVVNLFVLVYLTAVIRVDEVTAGLMYGALIVFSVPAPIVGGWLSDRFGRRPLIFAVYVGGAAGFVLFLLAGSSLVALWAAILVMGVFSFVESPQLQALLADIAPSRLRDISFATYFTLAFGVGALWVALYGWIVDAMGEAAGLPVVFVVMAVSFLAAAAAILPVREPEVHGTH